ncbi:surface-adhesin E family protein [Moraxella sp. RCAD0137]|uniref:surface-adhesin E family protein n=1 Tax=Moraxella sp. RCAD0137 TaxID=1775913 RepID=UPI000C9F2D34|nr:surface-adhesin E family protein [Moraxella sp. RCAD0137]PNP98347.1 hypothetical protein AZ602_04000 [Moraxella sp. RCAD0137]
MKKLLIAALATVMTQQAMAVNWFELGETFDGDKHYIDLDSIQADTLVNGTPVMTAWKQVELKQAQDVGGKKYWTGKYFVYYDCRARKFALEYSAAYDKQGRLVDSGNTSSFSRYSSANWKRAVPGTPSEHTLNIVCAYAT